jgi:membrane protein YdbS with pleckstrin-like domain
MAYPRNLIQKGETVALDLRPHWWYFSKHIFTGIPLLIILILVNRISNDDLESVLSTLFIVVAIAWALWLLYKYLEWTRTYFVVTSDRVVFRSGLLARRGVEIPLGRVNNINFHQALWERVIGAGNLDIQSAGEEGTSYFEDVRHPDGVQQEIYRQMEANNLRGTGAGAIGAAVADALHGSGGGAAPAGDDVAAKIEQLARLRDEGHITAEEFEERKRKLLDRL